MTAQERSFVFPTQCLYLLHWELLQGSLTWEGINAQGEMHWCLRLDVYVSNKDTASGLLDKVQTWLAECSGLCEQEPGRDDLGWLEPFVVLTHIPKSC